METSNSTFDYLKSVDRINAILDSSDTNYEEVNSIPSRDKLTYTNGYYVYCSALFVDIRGSKALAQKYKRPRLARIYRSYISEMVAVLKSHSQVREVTIEGDCTWGIFDTLSKSHIDELFSIAAKVSSAVDIINWRLGKKGIDPISVGIGLDYGRALMVKAGYTGSGINDVVWMGDLVGNAAALCSYGNRVTNTDRETMVSDVFYNNLNDDNKGLLVRNFGRSCYHGNVVSKEMDDWLKAQQ